MFAASKTASASGGYQISRSLRFNSADSAYLSRTPATATNRRTWTWSGWIKRSSLVKTNEYVLFACRPSAYTIFSIRHSGSATPDTILLEDNNGTNLRTTQVFRDVSAWYHIVLAVDTTQATSTDRVKLYVNGSQVTAFSATTYPTQNVDLQINTTNSHGVGGYSFSSLESFDGYMTEVNFVDGTQLTPSSFGETNAQTGVWQPKAYSGSYGTNGFYLNFSDNSNTTAATLGKDYSGNGNNWTPNNFSVTAGINNDSMVDTPTPYGVDTGVGGTVRGNYCTLNPLSATGTSTASDGNLYGIPSGTSNNGLYGTIAVNSGKWYWEDSPTLGGSYPMIGIARVDAGVVPSWQNAYGYAYYPSGNKYNNGSSAYGASYTTGDVIGVALDMDAGTVTFYKNGTSQGVAFSSLTGYITPYISTDNSSVIHWMNFGQRPFAYTAPSGFKALCTQNLPTPTIGATTATQAGKFFNPVLFDSTAGGAGTATGVGFQPDFTWAKCRSKVEEHVLSTVLQGNSAYLATNSTNAQASATNIWVANSDGYTAAAGSYQLSATYVAWNWKANGSGSTNTSGSITSTVSANTTSGFSVVTYTGTGNNATVGHGIGIAPSMVIVKSRSNALAWVVGHASVGFDKYLLLNATDAVATASTVWNSTNPTSTVFSIGTAGGTNTSGATYVAYCFSEVAGYSKFSSYTGNGSGDGPFIYCGFRPAYVMIKCSSTGGTSSNWIVQDTTRDTYNSMPDILIPNLSNAELTDATASTGYLIDCLSNGFKIRTNNSNWNANGSTYIFMAFATSPFKYSLAR
jgi:hypothetical protein